MHAPSYAENYIESQSDTGQADDIHIKPPEKTRGNLDPSDSQPVQT